MSIELTARGLDRASKRRWPESGGSAGRCTSLRQRGDIGNIGARRRELLRSTGVGLEHWSYIFTGAVGGWPVGIQSGEGRRVHVSSFMSTC